MGNAIKRLNPKVVQKVERNFLRLYCEAEVKALKKLPDPWKYNKKGKAHPPKIVAGMYQLKEAFGHSYDSVESEICSNEMIKKFFGVKKLPGHSVIHRGAMKLPMWWIKEFQRWIRIYITRFAKKRAGKGKVISATVIADSSGFTTRNSSSWYDIRIKRDNKKKGYLKLHILICAETGIILNFRITKGKSNDSPALKNLLKGIFCLVVIGDAAYANRNCCNAVEEKKALPIFLLKKNAKGRAKNSFEWKRMYRFSKKDNVLYSLIYHIRSFVESVFSSLKKRFGSFLKSIKMRMQRKELALKVISYNIRRMLCIKGAYEMGESLWIYQ